MDKMKFSNVLKTLNEKNIFDFLHEDTDIRLFEHSMIKFGNSFCKTDLNLLSKWFLDRANSVGAEKVAEELDDFLKAEEIPGSEVLILNGIEINEEINLSDDIKLIPFLLLPDSLAKADYSEYQTDKIMVPRSNFPPTAALICRNYSSPKFVMATPVLDSQKVYESRLPELIDACNFLALIGPSAPTPIASWWEADECVPYSRKFFYGSSAFMYDLKNYSMYKYSDMDAKYATELYSYYVKLSRQSKDRLTIPLERLKTAICRIKLEDKAIELGISMETTFLDENAGELGFRLSLYAARLLGETFDERKKIFDLTKYLYEHRSKSSHRGKIKHKKNNNNSVHETIDFGIDTVSKALKFIIKNDWPSWERLILE